MWIALASCFLVVHGSAALKTFEINLTWEADSPDGGPNRNLIKINGQFNGPLLEIDQGDRVKMVVNNHMPFNTSIHAHGGCLECNPRSRY